jgi:ankyrin repeat protein
VEAFLTAPNIDIINDRDYQGRTQLMKAASNGYIEIVKTLLAAPNIDVNAKDNYGRTPLMKAALNGRTEVVKALLAVPNIDINAKDPQDRTALIFAVEKMEVEVVKALLAAPNIDVNAKNKDGQTPLMMATDNWYDFGLVKVLISAPNIDIDAKNNNGRTAIDFANDRKNTEIVKILQTALRIDAPNEDNWKTLLSNLDNLTNKIIEKLKSLPLTGNPSGISSTSFTDSAEEDPNKPDNTQKAGEIKQEGS